jgi:uncharacterized protein
MVIAFVGTPHRIDDRGQQVVKALPDIGFDQYYQAELKGWLLYLEGSTDLAILQAFARTLGHSALAALERPFVHYLATNLPGRAREHFFGLMEAKPDLLGLALGPDARGAAPALRRLAFRQPGLTDCGPDFNLAPQIKLMKKPLLLPVCVSLVAGNCFFGLPAARAVEPTPFRVPAVMPDMLDLPSPSSVHVQGFLGARILANERNRLAKVDLEPLLAGFRKKPGVHPWIGEHIGKWMHASTLAWANTDDPALRAKLDYAAAELVKAQEPDGYLGTYVPEKRFGLYPGSDWDVWSHKYNLIGLLTYYQYTGNEPALNACRKMGDLLINTFGPGKKSILSAGTHVGMAATSVLEPMVRLYRFTADERYLDFAKYIVASWDEPHGPKILKTLLTEKSVAKTANGKAYEMLSNLVGLCELARVTGHREYLQAVLNAWEDIVAHRLYLTGSASQSEHFHGDYFLPNQQGANVAETCVTTTWVQLNSQLLRLTGEARFGDELEQTLYNHLAAAQRPDGAEWCYFTSLQGTKPYGPGISCCVSSGPRGMALAPQHAWLKSREHGRDGLVLNLFDGARVDMPLNGADVSVSFVSDFPRRGAGALVMGLKEPTEFALRIREPAWANPLRAEINGRNVELDQDAKGWAVIPAREWKDGDRVTLAYALGGRMVLGEHGNTGLAAN